MVEGAANCLRALHKLLKCSPRPSDPFAAATRRMRNFIKLHSCFGKLITKLCCRLAPNELYLPDPDPYPYPDPGPHQYICIHLTEGMWVAVVALTKPFGVAFGSSLY